MRIHFTSEARPKRTAKSLRRILAARGIERPLVSCYNLAARMYGYAHWHDMQSNVGNGRPADPDDSAVDIAIVEARHRQYVAALVAELPQMTASAESIVLELGPTAPSRTEPVAQAAVAVPSAAFERGGKFTIHRISLDDGQRGAAVCDHVAGETEYLMVEKNGQIRCLKHEGTVWSIEEAWHPSTARQNVVLSGKLLIRLGYLAARDGVGAARDFRCADDAEAERLLAATRDHVETDMDRAAFGLMLAVGHSYESGRATYEAYRGADPAMLRDAGAWPYFAPILEKWSRDRNGPREMLDFVATAVPTRQDAALVLDRMKGLHWRIAGVHFAAFALLAHLPANRVPTTQEEADAFARVVERIDSGAFWHPPAFGGPERTWNPDRTVLLADLIVRGLDAGRRDDAWRDLSRRMEEMAIPALLRCHRRHPDLDLGRPFESDVVMDRHAWSDERWSVLHLYRAGVETIADLAKWMSTNVIGPYDMRLSAAVRNGSSARVAKARYALPHDPRLDRCARAAAELVLSGVGFERLVEIGERRLRTKQAFDYQGYPDVLRFVLPAKGGALAEAGLVVDHFRPYFAPRYAGIGAEGIVAMCSAPGDADIGTAVRYSIDRRKAGYAVLRNGKIFETANPNGSSKSVCDTYEEAKELLEECEGREEQAVEEDMAAHA